MNRVNRDYADCKPKHNSIMNVVANDSLVANGSLVTNGSLPCDVGKFLYRNALHHAHRHLTQSSCCFAFASQMPFNQSLKRSSSLSSTGNCPSSE